MKKSNESREMYLKTIMTLEKSIPKVRNTDIAQALSYSKPSVTRAVRKLIEDGLIVNDKKNGISLTSLGRKTTEGLVQRYNVIYDFLIAIGAEKNTAEETACRIEHMITDELFDLIQNALIKGYI